MASSQIHIASPSATFGYSLRDHNLRDRWRNRGSNAAAFQNFKDFVDSLSGQPNKKSAPNVDPGAKGNKDNQTDSDLWVHIPTYKNDENIDDVPQSNKCDDRLAKKREIDFSGDSMKQNNRGSSAPVSPVGTTPDVPTNSGAVSSLLQRWRDFEAENSSYTSPMSSSRTTSVDGNNNSNNNHNVSGGGDNESLVDMRSETRSMNEDTFGDWESDRTALRGRAPDTTEKERTTLCGRASDATEKERTTLSRRASDATEKERTRVVDIIRKLTTPGINDESSNDPESSSPRTSLDSVTGSPRLRGRQAFGDLLMQLRADRQKELQGLVERNAVSKFAQKGRIQAMLRVQFLRHGSREAKDLITSSCTASEVNRLPQSAIKRLSQRFKSVFQDSPPRLKSPETEVLDSSQMKKSTLIKGIKATNQQGVVESSQIKISTSNQDFKFTNQQGVADSFQIEKSTFVEDIKNTHLKDAIDSFEVKKSKFVEDIKGTNLQDDTDSSKVKKSTFVEDVKSTILQVAIDSSQVEKSTSVQENKVLYEQQLPAPTPLIKNEVENTKAKESVLKSGIFDRAATSKDEKKREEKSILHADNSGNVHEEACSNSDILQKRTNVDDKNCSLHLSVETSFASTEVKDEKQLQPSGVCDESMNSSIDLQESEHINETFNLRGDDNVNTQCDWVEECTSNHYLSESEHGWVSDISHTQVGWEELHSDYERQADGVLDWICDISRPRSEWEGLRKERYQEMLDPFRQKEDIRILLERQSVSTFLSSSLRDCIDRLMDSRTQKKQFSHMGSQTDNQVTKKESEYNVEREEDENVIEKAEFGDAGYEQDDEGNDEDENQVEKLYEESVAYVDQTSSGLPFTSWNSIHGHETSEFSDQGGFSTPQQNLSSNSYSQESRLCSTMTNQCSIEMQLIYELRGHMVQLHEEMSEIRKSIKSCMNKLLEFHRSAKQDVVTTHSSSGQNRGRHSTQKKGLINRSMCCICYDVQVDCLLYRCGHMCSCFRCAHELQRSSGRCPVCEAPIIDIVRAHSIS